MKRVFSAGGIVFKKEGEAVKFLLIKNQSMRDPTKNYWGLPKGHVEEGEDVKNTALREVKEETGIETKIIDKVGDAKYVFTDPTTKEKFFKIVIYYLMEYASGDTKDHNWEVSEAEFVPFSEAWERLSFGRDKDLLKKAWEMANER